MRTIGSKKLLVVATVVAAAWSLSIPQAHAFCRDAIIDPGEECDDGHAYNWAVFRDGADCSDLGFEGGFLRCTTDCHFDTSDCTHDPSQLCGNGVREPGEGCEPRYDCCRYDCQDIEAQCGDLCVSDTEECDDGIDNSDEQPDHCRSDCKLPSCGDGVIDTGEQCDDGHQNSDLIPDACRLSCQRARCGDGLRDSTEMCDLGDDENGQPGSLCSAACALAECGNGTLDAGEVCDDHNPASDDGCLGTCLPNTCGDGFANQDVTPELLIEEVCDGASCRYDCGQALTMCGDGLTQQGEGCDLGAANSNLPNAACRVDCQPARCGDGIVDDLADPPEECDRNGLCLADCRRPRTYY
jgi:cysteine-rich repeat protein